MSDSTKIIAIDFDGTIVEHAYPEIGRPMMFAFATIKELHKKGHRLILWTYRQGKYLDDAVAFCQQNGVEFYAVNENYPGEMETEGYSRKLLADLFIDDRNVGGFPGWSEVWQMLHPGGGAFTHQLKNEAAHLNYPSTFRRWFGF